MTTLSALYRSNSYFVREYSGCLLVGFKPDTVSFIVKEIWNEVPLMEKEAEQLYAELSGIGKKVGCRHFRVVAYGGYLPEALSFEMYGLTVCDRQYVKTLEDENHIELFSHNEAAYRAIVAGFEQFRIGAVVQATGTGKSYLIARYLVDHAHDKMIVIAPNVTILGEIQKAVGGKAHRVKYCTFQSLVNRRREEQVLQADHIIIDEFHHFGAEVWGEAVREVIGQNPHARVLGTSATPIRPEGMIDTVDVYFEGNLFYELTLPQAWQYGILPVPLLVQSVYGLTGKLDKLQRSLDRSGCLEKRRHRIQRKLDAARMDFKTSLGAAALIRRFLPEEVRKLVVFCRDKESLNEMRPEVTGWLEEAGRTATVFEVHNGQSERVNSQVLKAFRENTDRLHVLFSINMLIEGLHVEGVDAVLFLRRTESYIVTLQQLGRCLKAGSSRRPVVLDFVNNLSGKAVYDVMARDRERTSFFRAPNGFEGVADFKVTGFLSDIRKRVSDILSELEPWQIMFERLVEYRATEADWPSATEGKLGAWCNTQRIARKRGTLTEERISRLEEIGFEWEQHDSRWMQRFQELDAYYERHASWPKRNDGELGVWCNTQRQARKNGQLTKERIRRLDRIGFVWEFDPEEEWLKMFETLQTFFAEHGYWPSATEGRLGAWCATQRKIYKKGKMQENRLTLLKSIGFRWSQEEVWKERYESLKVFYAAHHRWPTSREGALGSWCSVQRRLYKSGKLTEERMEKLGSIGFWWA